MPAASGEWKKLLDDVGWKILHQLQQDARLSFAELGRRVGLSTPAVLERVRRREDTGIILGYHAELDAAKVGMPIMAFIRISVVGELLQRIIGIAANLDEVLECHRVTGPDCSSSRILGTFSPQLFRRREPGPTRSWSRHCDRWNRMTGPTSTGCTSA